MTSHKLLVPGQGLLRAGNISAPGGGGGAMGKKKESVGRGIERKKPWNEFSEVVNILETGKKVGLIERCIPLDVEQRI